MSIKRMVTKLALAFAAKKGAEVFQSAGGLNGIKAMLRDGVKAPAATQTAHSRGDIGQTSTSDSLGSILGAFGGGASSGDRGFLDQPFGAMLGTLAGALGHRDSTSTAARDMEAELHTADPGSDAESAPILRAMVQMARADGAVTESEQQTLFDILDDASASEQAVLRDALQEPVNASAIAMDTPHHARKEVYSGALLVGDPDQPAEKKFLSELAIALGLDHQEVGRLHRAMGKPVI